MTTLHTPPESATMPAMGPLAWLFSRHVLYPDRYAWYVLASALDVMVTVTVLVHLGAREVNTFAQWSIERFGTWGLIGLKFLSVMLVVAICEYVGRRRPKMGRLLATAAIFASLMPVFAAMVQIVVLMTRGEMEVQPWPHVEPGAVYLPGAGLDGWAGASLAAAARALASFFSASIAWL